MNTQNEKSFFIDIFNRSLNPLKQIDSLAMEKGRLNDKINAINFKLHKKLNIPALIFVPLFLGFFISANFYDAIATKINLLPSYENISSIEILKPLAITSLIIAIILIALFFALRQLYRILIVKTKINFLLGKIKALDFNINEIINQNIEILKNIPPRYCYYFSVNFMLGVLFNQRADSLKEAINVYEDQLHKWKMENYQQQLCEINRQQQASMVSMNFALKSINKNTKDIAVTTALDFIFK